MSLLLTAGVIVTALNFVLTWGYMCLFYIATLQRLLYVCMLVNDIVHMYASTEAFL